MPFNELQRRDSWPPTVLYIRDEDVDDTDPIDEDPLSFFVTSPEDIDIEDDEDLSAGIESSKPKSSQVQEVSPSTIQKPSPPFPLDDDDDDEDEDDAFGLAMPLSLKDFTRRYVSDGKKSRSTQSTEDGLLGLGIAIPITTVRGRATVRLTPSRSGRGRGQTRSLSARRPRSWQEPNPDLGSIMEEREGDEENKLGVANASRQELSLNAPATLYMEQAAAPPAKPKKRVHWAF
jgi:hypothetical protein